MTIIVITARVHTSIKTIIKTSTQLSVLVLIRVPIKHQTLRTPTHYTLILTIIYRIKKEKVPLMATFIVQHLKRNSASRI